MTRRRLPLALVLVASVAAGGACSGTRAEGAPEAAPDGPRLYADTCALCHGARGEGYVADNATALANPAFLATASDDFLYRSIARGRPGTTMSAWDVPHGGPHGDGALRALVGVLRGWQRTPSVDVPTGTFRGDAARGGAIYDQQCAAVSAGVRGWFRRYGRFHSERSPARQPLKHLIVVRRNDRDTRLFDGANLFVDTRKFRTIERECGRKESRTILREFPHLIDRIAYVNKALLGGAERNKQTARGVADTVLQHDRSIAEKIDRGRRVDRANLPALREIGGAIPGSVPFRFPHRILGRAAHHFRVRKIDSPSDVIEVKMRRDDVRNAIRVDP